MPIIPIDHLAPAISYGLTQPDHKNIGNLDVFVFLILCLICILYQYKFIHFICVDIFYIGIFNHFISYYNYSI